MRPYLRHSHKVCALAALVAHVRLAQVVDHQPMQAPQRCRMLPSTRAAAFCIGWQALLSQLQACLLQRRSCRWTAGQRVRRPAWLAP